MRNKASKTVLSILILLVMISIIITSCKPPRPTPPSSTNTNWLPTTTFTTSLTPTRYCPSNISYISPTPITYSPLLLAVLFNPQAATDTEGKGRDFSLEYKDGTKSTDPLKYILNIMPHILYAGDQYAIFQFGYKYYEDARMNRYSVATLDVPPSRGVYQSKPTITLVLTPTLYEPGLPGMATQIYYKTEVKKYSETSTAIAFDGFCANATFVAQVNSTATAWSTTQTVQWGELSTQAIKASTPRVRATPYDENEVYNGLSHATTLFKSQCSHYSRCVLLIISSMQDHRAGYKGMIDEYGIDLSNVEIITVLPNCEDIFQPSCKPIEDIWTGEFQQAHAKSNTFVNGRGPENGSGLENYLISQFRGER